MLAPGAFNSRLNVFRPEIRSEVHRIANVVCGSPSRVSPQKLTSLAIAGQSHHIFRTIFEADFLLKSRKSRIDTLQEQVDSLVTQVALMKVLAPILCNGPTY